MAVSLVNDGSTGEKVVTRTRFSVSSELDVESRRGLVGPRFAYVQLRARVALFVLATYFFLAFSFLDPISAAQTTDSDRTDDVRPFASSDRPIRIERLDVTGSSAKQGRFGLRLTPNVDRPTEVRIELGGFEPQERLKLAKLNAEDGLWKRLFIVSVATARQSGQPGMLGEYRFENDELVFEPRFPLWPGMDYRAVLHVGRLSAAARGSDGVIGWSFSLPAPEPAPPSRVVRVYPSRDVLPENLLKFYVHFSAPMSRGEAYQRIGLLDSTGTKIEYPFLELGEELWDPSGTRFTIFFDPGRIKRGLKPREEMGPAIEEDKSYTLVIDRDWPDASGRPMQNSFRKPFHVIAPDDVQPDPENWQLSVPDAQSKAPLVVEFAEPLDHSMLQGVLVVFDDMRQRVEGAITVEADETRWIFRPANPWRAGRFELIADTALEDVAGNSIGQPFEVDVFRPIERSITTKTISLPFRISAPDERR